jgi:hypothetical protein
VDKNGGLERSFSDNGNGDGGWTGASPTGSTPTTTGEGGGAASPAGSGLHNFFLLSSSFLVKSLGSCWSCMQIYEELCCVLVGSCLKTNNSERSCWIFSYELMLLIRKDEELYNVMEISKKIVKNFV